MSSHNARERILARLHASGTEQTEVPEAIAAAGIVPRSG
jgi:hypothetical protein